MVFLFIGASHNALAVSENVFSVLFRGCSQPRLLRFYEIRNDKWNARGKLLNNRFIE